MARYLLVLLLALLLLVAPDGAQAETSAASVNTELVDYPKVPRPSYRRYRGNSRAKKKHFWWYRRWAARRKAKRQGKAVPVRSKPRGVIRVDAPDVKMPAPPPAPKP